MRGEATGGGWVNAVRPVMAADAGISSRVGANDYCSEGIMSRLFVIPAEAGISHVRGEKTPGGWVNAGRAVIPADAGISSCVGANHYCSEGTVSRLFAIPADAGLSQVGGDWPRSPDLLVHRFQHSGALSTGADRR